MRAWLIEQLPERAERRHVAGDSFCDGVLERDGRDYFEKTQKTRGQTGTMIAREDEHEEAKYGYALFCCQSRAGEDP